MFSRISQIHRHLSRQIPTLTHTSATVLRPAIMTTTSTPQDRSTRMIHTAGCIIIGDEVLGGKTTDTNSAYFAKFCFSLGINLKRVEVISDDEGEIVEATRRMSSKYDFVVTSGGIGPTHDDITYQSIAKAFDLPLILHDEAFEKMKKLSKPRPGQEKFNFDQPSPALEAKLRMIRLPIDKSRPLEDQVLFVRDDLWVPVSVVNGNIHILPGVPRLFEGLLDGLKPRILPRLTDPEGKGIYRLRFSTPLPESEVATYLTDLASRVEPSGIKVGSYPRWGKKRNTVTLVGRDKDLMDTLIDEVEKNVQGKKVDVENELDEKEEA